MAEKSHLPTARTTLAAHLRLIVWCTCGHQVEADLAAIIARGHGDVPLRRLPFRCGRGGGREVQSVVAGQKRPADE
ncbi:MAG: hypothetical protein JO047_07730 [Alphaproteobacteria bacterium]|nr:hypothetical protein [Acidisphaera sp.]MBV9756929.1 hypothetical protein [Alphaproteobacteria bacterium]